MKLTPLRAALLASLACAAAGPMTTAARGCLIPLESAARGAAGPAELLALRAGGLERERGLGLDERAVLQSAQRAHSELLEQRAGEMHLSDREIKLILIAAGVVLLIVLLA